RLELEAEQPNASILAIASEVDGLRELKAVVDHASASLPALVAELEVVNARIRSAATEIGWNDQPVETLRAKLPGLPELEEIRALIERRSGTDEQLRSAREAQAEVGTAIAKLTQQ